MSVPHMSIREFFRRIRYVTAIATTVAVGFWSTAAFFMTDSLETILVTTVAGGLTTGVVVGFIYAVTALTMTIVYIDALTEEA